MCHSLRTSKVGHVCSGSIYCCSESGRCGKIVGVQDALEVAVKMALSIPLSDIIAYRKVAKAYFALLEVLAANHVPTIASQVYQPLPPSL